jgi:hypothetical protein
VNIKGQKITKEIEFARKKSATDGSPRKILQVSLFSSPCGMLPRSVSAGDGK